MRRATLLLALLALSACATPTYQLVSQDGHEHATCSAAGTGILGVAVAELQAHRCVQAYQQAGFVLAPAAAPRYPGPIAP